MLIRDPGLRPILTSGAQFPKHGLVFLAVAACYHIPEVPPTSWEWISPSVFTILETYLEQHYIAGNAV